MDAIWAYLHKLEHLIWMLKVSGGGAGGSYPTIVTISGVGASANVPASANVSVRFSGAAGQHAVLPASPTDGQRVKMIDVNFQWGVLANRPTFDGNGHLVEDPTQPGSGVKGATASDNQPGDAVTFEWVAASNYWKVI